MKCTNCGAEVPESSKFCMNCGAPLPKECPKCHAPSVANAKFCFNCGCKFDAPAGRQTSNISGISLGDKNAVAGDIIGEKEQYNVSGNATIVQNRDETKETAKCHICGSIVLKINGYECPECKEFTCKNCFDQQNGVCKNCSKEITENHEQQYKNQVSMLLSKNGKIDADGSSQLKALAEQLGISSLRAEMLKSEVIQDSIHEAELTSFEKLNMDKALNLYYENYDFIESEKILRPIYESNPENENVLSLYLPTLYETEIAKALEIASGIKYDSLAAYLTLFNDYLVGKDYVKAEPLLSKMQKMWPDNNIVKCHTVLYYIAMSKEFDSSEWLDKAEEEIKKFSSPVNKLDSTWQMIARIKTDRASGKIKINPAISKEFCKKNNVYCKFLKAQISNHQRYGYDFMVGSDDDCDFKTIQAALDYAAEDDFIFVKPGLYKEQLSFKKEVNLIGYDNIIGHDNYSKESFADEHSWRLPIVCIPKGTCCKIDAPACIDGFVFTNDEHLGFSSIKETYTYCQRQKNKELKNLDDEGFSSLLLVSNSCRLKNIAVLSCEQTGITIQDCCCPSINDSFVVDTGTYGIYCTQDSLPIISNTKILLCQIGLGAANNSKPEIKECDIFKNRRFGVHIAGNSSPLVESCKIHNNAESKEAYSAISVSGKSIPRIQNCEIFENFAGGIMSGDDAAGYIKNCNSHNNGTRGITLRNNSKTEVIDCDLYENKTDGIYIENECTSKISGCKLFKNQQSGIRIYDNSRPHISDCKLNDNSRKGSGNAYIAIRGKSAPVISGCFFSTGYYCPDIAFSIREDACPEISNCEVIGASLYIDDNASGFVKNCTFKVRGVKVSGNAKTKISACMISGTYQDSGIEIDGSASPEISGCIVSKCFDGIVVKGNSTPTFTDCESRANQYNEGSRSFGKSDRRGICITDSSAPVFNNCKVFDNVGNGCEILLNAAGSLKGCEIYDNKGHSIVMQKSAKTILPKVKNIVYKD